jgi:hypothetical protein
MSVKESLDGISILRSKSANPPWWSHLECIVENDNACPIVRNVDVLNFPAWDYANSVCLPKVGTPYSRGKECPIPI